MPFRTILKFIRTKLRLLLQSGFIVIILQNQFLPDLMPDDNLKPVIIDIGNTLTKIAIFSESEIAELKRFKTDSPADMLAFLQELPVGTHCMISSVAGIPALLEDVLRNKFKTLLLDEHTPLPIKNLYKTQHTLGRDRIAAAVAANDAFPAADLLVIDAGTAITIDLVTRRGEYLGGAISPGIEMRFRALHTFTKHLPLVQAKDIDFLTGTTTEESISTGVINGVAAEIDGIINKYRGLHPEIRIVFGGGDSNFLVKRLKNSIFALQNPVLTGLHLILKYNIENHSIT
jgi:type III pantothenate kinase